MWIDTRTRSVQGQLTHRNAHTIYTQVAQAKNARSVGDDGYVDLMRPIAQDIVNMASICIGNVKTLRLSE